VSPSRYLGALTASLLCLSACGGSSREDGIRPLLAALSEPTASPAQLSGLYLGSLASDLREVVASRAALLSEALGVTVHADEVLRLDGLGQGLRLNKRESASTSEGAGQVTLHFARVGAGAALMPEPVVWQVTDEGGRWRLRSTELRLEERPLGEGR